MKLIFWGLLITCLHFNLGAVDQISSLLGWYMVNRGLHELPPCSARRHAERAVRIMILLRAAIWCLQALALSGAPAAALVLCAVCGELYTLLLLIRMLSAIESIVSHSMPVEILHTVWRMYLLCTIVLHIPFSTFLTAACALIAVGCRVALLYWFLQTAKAYEEALAHPIEILPPDI